MFKLKFFFGVIATFLMTSPVQAQPVEVSSRITEVTVFSDRALVTRQVSVRLSGGVQTVKLSNLPGMIEQESVSVRGKGDSKITLYGAALQVIQLEEAQSPEVVKLEKELQLLQDKRQSFENSKLVLKNKLKFLESIQASSSETVGKDLVTQQPALKDVSEVMAFVEHESQNAYDKSVSIDRDIEEVNKEINRVERELNQLREQQWRQRSDIVIDLESQGAQEAVLEVSYRVLQAYWKTRYEVRATSQSQELPWMVQGVVRQNTGEDWKDVKLTLSTAKPALSGRMPEIQPWYLRKREPVAYRMSSDNKLAKTQMMAGAPSPAMDKLEEAVAAEAAVETGGLSVQYVLSKPETVPSDNQPQTLNISTRKLSAQFAYETTPRLSAFVYWRAKVQNNTEEVWLPGAVHVFMDGNFVSSSSINLIGPGETTDIFLGVDERIRVEQKRLKAKVDVSVLPGVHGRIKTIDYEFLTTIENFKGETIDVVVLDQIPVSDNDEIKIENLKENPAPSEEDKEKPGVRKWKLTLKPKQKTLMSQAYRIKFPVDFSVEGL